MSLNKIYLIYKSVGAYEDHSKLVCKVFKEWSKANEYLEKKNKQLEILKEKAREEYEKDLMYSQRDHHRRFFHIYEINEFSLQEMFLS